MARQAAFAARNQVPPGWLMHRDADWTGAKAAGIEGLIGAETKGGAYLLVEEPMLRSCFPRIEVAPYQDSLRRRWLRSPMRIALRWTKTVPSGDVVCRPSPFDALES